MIEAYSFGRMTIKGVTYGNEPLIIHGKVRRDWRRKTGHLVDIDDAREILSSDPDVVVLGKGESGMMKIDPSLREMLEKRGVELIEENTARAIHVFNRLWQEDRNVSAGFHLTC